MWSLSCIDARGDAGRDRWWPCCAPRSEDAGGSDVTVSSRAIGSSRGIRRVLVVYSSCTRRVLVVYSSCTRRVLAHWALSCACTVAAPLPDRAGRPVSLVAIWPFAPGASCERGRVRELPCRGVMLPLTKTKNRPWGRIRYVFTSTEKFFFLTTGGRMRYLKIMIYLL